MPPSTSNPPTMPLMLQLETLLALTARAALLPWSASSTPFAAASNGWNTSWPMPGPMQDWMQPRPAPLPNAQLPLLALEVEKLLAQRASALAEGLKRYQAHRNKSAPERASVWQSGNVHLRAVPPKGRRIGAPIFIVPSLINRYSILDLTPETSFVEALSAQGHPVFLLDWDTPGVAEQALDAAGYVERRLLPALRAMVAATGQPPVLMGYCMGGLLALAAAQLAPELSRALVLLATPWDFSAPQLAAAGLMPHQVAQLEQWIAGQTFIDPSTLDHWFYLQQPWSVHAKFRALGGMKEGDKSTDAFLAAEAWLHDGVPLTAPVARDGWVRWGYHNDTKLCRWRVGGQAIDPRRIAHPSLLICPREDAIVPPACSRPLVKLLPNAQLVEPPTGHIGALVGASRKASLWDPTSEFIATL